MPAPSCRICGGRRGYRALGDAHERCRAAEASGRKDVARAASRAGVAAKHVGAGGDCFRLAPDAMCAGCRQTLGYPVLARCSDCGEPGETANQTCRYPQDHDGGTR